MLHQINGYTVTNTAGKAQKQQIESRKRKKKNEKK